jgi:hypothetical protein
MPTEPTPAEIAKWVRDEATASEYTVIRSRLYAAADLIERQERDLEAALQTLADHDLSLPDVLLPLKSSVQIERLTAERDKLRTALARIFALPNWSNRCGGWKDINDALYNARKALEETTDGK